MGSDADAVRPMQMTGAGEKKTAARNTLPPDLAEAAVEVCRRLLGVEATPVPASGPIPKKYKRRQLSSIRLAVGTTTLFATRRRHARYAKHEAAALTTLEPLGAPVPKLLAGGGEWLIQQDVGRFRLTQKLQGASESEGIALLDAAVAALWQCQDAGAKAALGAGLKNLGGYGPLLETPAKLGKILKAPAPKLAAERILPLIRAPERVFIKWDARPANAIVAENGAIFWIDWEEWGLRCRLDDLVWLLCDEWVPFWPEAEDALINRQIRSRATPFPPESRGAETYVAAFGTLHLLLRLNVILKTKGAAGWWDEEDCHAHELLGVTRNCAVRLLSRAAHWASKVPEFEPLAGWIRSLPERLPA